MASVRVAISGLSRADLKAQVDQIAREAQLRVSTNNEVHEMTSDGTPTYRSMWWLESPSLSETQLRAVLAPFVEDDTDPGVVRVVILPSS
jgi:hypothetical protein